MKLNLIYCLVAFSSLFSQAAATKAANYRRNDEIAGELTGTVTDKSDGKALPGVTVYIADLKRGAATDAKGKYVFNRIPKGVYLVQFSFIGYGSITRTVDFTKTSVLDVQLQFSSIEAGEVVITGVSRATEVKRSPIPIVAVSKAFIDQRAAAGNVIDMIANIPGINAVTTGPNVSKPFIHGLGYNRVVTLQDGIRQEGQQWGDEHGIEVDQNSIDRIEIIKGPASLSYGSDAIGGVVNLISPVSPPEGSILGSVSQTYGTNNGLFNTSLRLYGNQNGLVYGAILSAKEAKDYHNQHDGRVYNTAFREKDARVMLGVNKSWGYSYFNATLFDDLQEIPDGSRDSVTRQFTKQISDADNYRPTVTNSELNSYSISPNHQHVQLYRIYNNSNFNIGDGNLIVNLGYQYSHRREFTHPTQPLEPGLNLQLNSYTYDVKYNFNIANGYETSVGLNGFYQNNSLGEGTAFPIPAYHQFDLGPFAIIKKSFGKLDLSTGVRYDHRSFTGQSANLDTTTAYYPKLFTGNNPTTAPNVVPQFAALNKSFAGFSGSFGGTYNFSNEFLLKANISRGFRAPSIAELSANGPDPGSQIYHVGNSNFKPEFSLQEDIGAFLTLPFLSASVEVFNNSIQNYIFQQQVLDASGAPVVNQGYNEFTYVQSKAKIYGGEFYLDVHPVNWLHFANSLSLTYGENQGLNGKGVADSLKYLPFIPPLHTHSELKANFKNGVGCFRNLYAMVGFDHYNAQNRFFGAYGTETSTAGYNLLSAGIGGNFVDKNGKEKLKIFIEGTNLNNEVYQSHLSRLKYFDPNVTANVTRPGIFNMGRNISFKLIIPIDFSPHAKPTSGS
ncbi:TonB-dependent receptor [Mucilaginibacter sp. UYCu711]|uniref:TonB-dependent receptor n=1 Tax=Mucilaginibacter sp. UYCu711 TaxID=3156339 RepID=UPI003D1EA6F8